MSIGFDPGPARKLSWRLLRRLWMLLPVLGFGCLGAAALIFIGARMSRPAVWISGIGYLAISTALFFAIGATDAETALSNWLVGAWLLTWLVTMLHALAINPSWLRWKAGHVPWHAAPAMPLAPPPGYPAARPRQPRRSTSTRPLPRNWRPFPPWATPGHYGRCPTRTAGRLSGRLGVR